jgi:hypothetical protein
MPLCHFFLNAGCRYGDSCRFRHEYAEVRRTAGSRAEASAIVAAESSVSPQVAADSPLPPQEQAEVGAREATLEDDASTQDEVCTDTTVLTAAAAAAAAAAADGQGKDLLSDPKQLSSLQQRLAEGIRGPNDSYVKFFARDASGGGTSGNGGAQLEVVPCDTRGGDGDGDGGTDLLRVHLTCKSAAALEHARALLSNLVGTLRQQLLRESSLSLLQHAMQSAGRAASAASAARADATAATVAGSSPGQNQSGSASSSSAAFVIDTVGTVSQRQAASDSGDDIKGLGGDSADRLSIVGGEKKRPGVEAANTAAGHCIKSKSLQSWARRERLAALGAELVAEATAVAKTAGQRRGGGWDS